MQALQRSLAALIEASATAHSLNCQTNDLLAVFARESGPCDSADSRASLPLQ
jgi:hypothetical protein